MSSHSPLRRTSVRCGSITLKAWSWKVAALRSICSGSSIGRSADWPGRIADAGGVVADDQDDDVAGVLELAQLLEHDHVAEVDVGGRRVDPELHPQRPSLAGRAARACAPARPPAASRRRSGTGRRQSQRRPRADLWASGPMLNSRLARADAQPPSPPLPVAATPSARPAGPPGHGPTCRTNRARDPHAARDAPARATDLR